MAVAEGHLMDDMLQDVGLTLLRHTTWSRPRLVKACCWSRSSADCRRCCMHQQLDALIRHVSVLTLPILAP
jgi:hypothetical protein